ncbi:MAG TPA: hypothetical protein VGF99_13695 [Myxococcota bacterium]
MAKSSSSTASSSMLAGRRTAGQCRSTQHACSARELHCSLHHLQRSNVMWKYVVGFFLGVPVPLLIIVFMVSRC